MTAAASKHATIALMAWLIGALALGYFYRNGIEYIFGPDSWWLVAGWVGAIGGLFHFLIVLVFSRQPRG